MARRLSTVAISNSSSTDHDHQHDYNRHRGLAQSLSQLSLVTSADYKHAGDASRRLSETSRPLKPSSRPTSRPPVHRVPSRSPSGRESRPVTPPLLRKASMNSLHSASGHGPAAAARAASSRRSSVTQALSPHIAKSPSTEEQKQQQQQHRQSTPALTAASIAAEYFRAEMRIHHSPEAADTTLPADTVVILHNAVYGHRFSRPRTSRSALSTIVERPERIKAAVLGVSLAYVRLGDRHDQGAFPIHPRAIVADTPSIPFRIRTSTRTVALASPAVTNVHGAKWMEELKMMCETAESKLALGGRELQRPENMARDEPAKALHQGDLYLCAESLDAMEGALGAVCDGVDAVFSSAPMAPRRAFVAVRPPGHHCAAAHPSGFCWVNNVLVGIMHAALAHGLTHAAIIDFDLHHGDGSQAIVWQHNARGNLTAKNAQQWKKTSIGYYSLHDINSYPCEMGDEDKVKNASLCIDNAHGQSVWNVHLQPWKTPAEFWDIYESKYSVILQKVRAYLDQQARKVRAQGREPKAVIFFSAGFDASEWESDGMQRHQVNVPTEFYARLSQDVVKIANEKGLYVDGRIVSVLEGGYSDRALYSGVFSHLSGLVGHQQFLQATENGYGISYGMGQKLGTIAEPEQEGMQTQPPAVPLLQKYDASWWSSQQLDCLESLIAGPQSPLRKPRTATPPTYFSPTQASSAKVTDPAKMRRSLSGLSSIMTQRPRASSPVAPDVPWTVAAHELSKILIPTDRQTDSCKAEDLNAEATRVRRERQSFLVSVTMPPAPVPQQQQQQQDSRPTSRMSLRERKPRSAWFTDEAGERVKLPPFSPTKQPASSRSLARAKSTEASGQQHRRSRRVSEGAAARSSPERVDATAVPVPSLPVEYEHMAASSRPPTSGSSSSRAGSGLSGQTAEGEAASVPSVKLQVKKTRLKVGAATKEATMPKTPRGSRRVTTPASKAKTVAAKQQQQQSVEAASEPPVLPDLDKITMGMKKIKINLITQSQREREREGAEMAAKEKQTTAMSLVPSMSDEADGGDGGLVSRSTDAATMLSPASVDGAEDAVDELFVHYQPEGPTPVAVEREGSPLQWLPPNVTTPSAKTPARTGKGRGVGMNSSSPVKTKKKLTTPTTTTTTTTRLVTNKQLSEGSPAGTVLNLFEYTASGIPFAPRSPLKS